MNGAAAPRVTAVVTTFRPNFGYLAEAIESALAQTLPVRVLVSDSAMDDEVRSFVMRYGDRVTYRHNGGVVGPAANHRNAIAEVRTPYLALLGHDDVWEPDFLARLVPALDAHPQCILAFSDHWFVDGAGQTDVPLTDQKTHLYGRDAIQPGLCTDVATLLIAQSVPVAMAAVLRTPDTQRHPIPDRAGPAYDLWLHYALAGEQRPYWYTPERLTRWRFHAAAGTSAGNPDWYEGSAFTWDAVAADARFASVHRAAHVRAATAWLALAKALLRRNASVDQIRNAAERSIRHKWNLQAQVGFWIPGLLRLMLNVRRQKG